MPVFVVETAEPSVRTVIPSRYGSYAVRYEGGCAVTAPRSRLWLSPAITQLRPDPKISLWPKRLADHQPLPYNFGMFDAHRLLLFFAAALLLAITPGPGIFYVLARSLAGGKREGILSSLGTFFGGLFHVFAAALGLSAILAASAVAFHTVKYAGAAYLVWLGIRMIRTRNAEMSIEAPGQSNGAFRQGVFTEVLNPKTALFFLSFIPQFVLPAHGHVFFQFAALGCISVSLNTAADLVVVGMASPLERKLKNSVRFRRRQRTASGLGMITLGAYLALADSK
jgi:threonine/homoserine/homoserine lactone efflux protein